MSSRDKDGDKDKDRKSGHRKSGSGSKSKSSKSSSLSDPAKKKKSSSHRSSSSGTTQNTRQNNADDEFDEQDIYTQSIEEGGPEESAGSAYSRRANPTDVMQSYLPAIGYTHSRPSGQETLLRQDTSMNNTAVPERLSQPQYGSSEYPTQNAGPAQAAGNQFPTTRLSYSTPGTFQQEPQVSYTSPAYNALPMNTQQPSVSPEATGYTYTAPSYVTGSRDLRQAGSHSRPRAQPWQDPSMAPNLEHRPAEPWNEDSTDPGTIGDDTNRIVDEDDITGS